MVAAVRRHRYSGPRPIDVGNINLPGRAANRFASAGVGFDVTGTDRTQRRFTPITGIYATADRHLSGSAFARLREICRAHDRNSALMSGILNRALDNIFGPAFGFTPSTGDPELDALAAPYIRNRMTAALADAANLRDFPELARTALRAVWVDGDCLLAHDETAAIIPFEADQLATPTDRSGTARIVQGVELGPRNRPLAYHVLQRASRGDYGMADVATTTQRLLAEDCLFPAHRTRFGQTRGYPVIAAALGLYERLDGYLDNETLAAEINAMTGLKIKRTQMEAPPDGVRDNEDVDTQNTYEQVQQFESGMIFDLKPGEDVEMVQSGRPGPNFEPYIITVCRIVGAAVGFPLELLLLDFSKTTYSSARASLTEARRTFRRWQTFTEANIARPWHARQITRGIASGELPPRPELYQARVQWPGWPYIDPLTEANANRVLVGMASKSISSCIREQGGDPTSVFDELESDLKVLRGKGIEPILSTAGTATGAGKPESGNGEQGTGNSEEAPVQ